MPNDADDNTRAPTSQMKLTRPLPAAGPSLESVSEQNAERDRGAQLFSRKKNPRRVGAGIKQSRNSGLKPPRCGRRRVPADQSNRSACQIIDRLKATDDQVERVPTSGR